MARQIEADEWRELLTRFRAGKVSRRTLLRAVAAAGGAAAVGPMLQACGGSAPAQSGGAPAGGPAASSPVAANETPVQGGTLTMGIYQEPPNLDPHVSGSATAGR